MSEQKPQDIDLAQELRELGEQLKKAIQIAREHPNTKEFERQITQAVNELGSQIDRAVKSTRADERVKNVTTQVKQAAQSFKESGATEDIAHGLAKGVRTLNEQIRHAVEDAEKSSREHKQE